MLETTSLKVTNLLTVDEKFDFAGETVRDLYGDPTTVRDLYGDDVDLFSTTDKLSKMLPQTTAKLSEMLQKKQEVPHTTRKLTNELKNKARIPDIRKSSMRNISR